MSISLFLLSVGRINKYSDENLMTIEKENGMFLDEINPAVDWHRMRSFE